MRILITNTSLLILLLIVIKYVFDPSSGDGVDRADNNKYRSKYKSKLESIRETEEKIKEEGDSN